MRDCVVAWSSDQVPERHFARYAGGKDVSLTEEHTPGCVCGYVIGHACCGKARRDTELIILCNRIVARVPAIHDRCVACLEKPAKG